MADPKLEYEAGQNVVAMVAMTDSGDHMTFNSAEELWSNRSGYTASVKPNGILTGLGVSVAASGTNNLVDVAGGTCNLAGVETTVVADTDVSCARPDATYIVLSCAALGYTNCVAGDIGKTVTGSVTGDTGVLIAYNNTTRQWVVDQTDSGDTFDDDDENLAIGTGTGAGTMNAVGAPSTHKIVSLTVTSAGAVAAVVGTEGVAFATGRGTIGGPPWIPTTSIEIGQVRYTSSAAAAVDPDEVFQVPDTHREMALFPTWEEERIRVTAGAIGYAGPTFAAALNVIHSDNAGVATATKKVYASYYTPSFAMIAKTSDFVRPAESYSVNSTEYYGGAKASRSTSIGQGSFKALSNTLNEGFMQYEGQDLWFRFKNDRLLTLPCVYCQGVLGVSETFQTDGGIEVSATISAEGAGNRVLA
jgi:hypothetical protein